MRRLRATCARCGDVYGDDHYKGCPADARAVTRATLRALRLDPDTHDIYAVKGRHPGFRITADGKPLKFIRERDFHAAFEDPDTKIAFKAFVNDERRRARDPHQPTVDPHQADPSAS